MRKVLLIVGLILLLQGVGMSTAAAAPPQKGGYWHTVRYGETLYSIGRWYGVNPYAICQANGLRNCNYIWAGQRLWIPSRPAYREDGYRPYQPTAPWYYNHYYRVDPWVRYRNYHPYPCAGQTFCNP